MPFVAMTCPSCGGNLPVNAKKQVVLCTYCGASVMYERWVARRDYFRRLRERELRGDGSLEGPRLMLDGIPHRVLGPLARGETSDVVLVERIDGARTILVVKWLRRPEDANLLNREWAALTRLGQENGQGSEHFTRRLPAPVGRGAAFWEGQKRQYVSYRYQSGFFLTLGDVQRAHGSSLDPAHGVWIWRRILEPLSWLHRVGTTHRAILPEHVVVHVRDHGAILVGWSVAAAASEPRLLASVSWQESFYPAEVLAGEPFRAEHDLSMSARCIGSLLAGGQGHLPPSSTPEALADLILTVIAADPAKWPARDARSLDALLQQRARAVFGPPQYRKLVMPGWK